CATLIVLSSSAYFDSTSCHPPLHLYSFSNAPATPDLYTLSLHDALPISLGDSYPAWRAACQPFATPSSTAAARSRFPTMAPAPKDRKSTRLNSSHLGISYAVFCLKKKKNKKQLIRKKTHALTRLPHQ